MINATHPSLSGVRPGAGSGCRAHTLATMIAARLAHPLDRFYDRIGRPMPPLAEIDPAAIPQPYRQLLVHDDDMTPTLERFYKCDVVLQVLSKVTEGSEYFREVVLRSHHTGKPIEFGAIKINLDRFAPLARQHVLEEREPLGHILKMDHVRHISRPRAFLRVASDELIDAALGLSGARILYGRSNTLFCPDGQALAEVVEILPP